MIALLSACLFFEILVHVLNCISESARENCVRPPSVQVAEHSFQVAMPNSPLLLNHLCFSARFLQESRLTTEVFILAFWQGCMLLPW